MSCPVLSACASLGMRCQKREHQNCDFYRKLTAERAQHRGIARAKKKWFHHG
jgi:hypothetical protein